MTPTAERIFRAAMNTQPSPEQVKEWAERDAENARLESYDHKHPDPKPRTALTGWTGRTLDPDDVDWSPAYAEPGYSDNQKGILFADWNNVSKRVMSLLERAGYSLEW